MSEYSVRSETATGVPREDDWELVGADRMVGQNLDGGIGAGVQVAEVDADEAPEAVFDLSGIEADDSVSETAQERQPETQPPAEVEARPPKRLWVKELDRHIALQTGRLKKDNPQATSSKEIVPRDVRDKGVLVGEVMTPEAWRRQVIGENGQDSQDDVPHDNGKRLFNPESIPPSEVAQEVTPWFNNLESFRGKAQADTTTLAVAVVAAEVDREKNGPKVSAEVIGDFSEEAAPAPSLYEQARENPARLPDIIKSAKLEEGSPLEVFASVKLEDFRERVRPPEDFTPDDFFEAMRFTTSESGGGKGELDIYCDIVHPNADEKGLRAKMAKRKDVHYLNTIQEQDIKKQRDSYNIRKLRDSEGWYALSAAQNLVTLQNERLNSRYRLTQLENDVAIPQKLPPTKAAEERLRLFQQLQYMTVGGAADGACDGALLETQRQIVELRKYRRNLESMEADPTGWTEGKRPELHSPEAMRDEAELAALTLMVDQRSGEGESSFEEILQTFVGKITSARNADVYADDLTKLVDGELPPEVREATFAQEVMMTRAVYGRLLQTSPAKAQEYLAERTDALREMVRGEEAYKEYKLDPSHLSESDFPFDVRTVDVEDVRRVRLDAMTELSGAKGRSGAEHQQHLAYLKKLEDLEAVLDSDDGRHADTRERLRYRQARNARSDILTNTEMVVVEGNFPEGVPKPGVVRAYLAANVSPDTLISYYEPVGYPEWTLGGADDAQTKEIRTAPSPDSTKLWFNVYEGQVPTVYRNPDHILRRIDSGGAAVLAVQYNGELAEQIVARIASPDSPYAKDYSFQLVPSSELEFSQANNERVIEHGVQNGLSLVMYRRQADGSPSQIEERVKQRQERA